jgi:CHAT domain-containing protein
MRTPLLLLLLSFAALCVAAGARPPSARPAAAAAAVRQPPPRGEQTGDPSRQAQELLALSARQNFDDHALALETAGSALALFQAAGDSEGTARAYAHIARCHTAQSDLAEATQNYESALQIWRDLNNPPQQARVLISLGFVESRKGEWRNAVSFYTRAEALLAGYDEPAVSGRIASGLADVFNENGLPEKGLAQYQRALEYFRRTEDTRDDTLTLLEIGSTQYLLGHYQEALAQFQQTLLTLPPDGLDAAQCHHYIGRVYGATGEYEAALRHLRYTLPIYERAGNLNEAAYALALMGQVYERQGRREPASRHYRQALDTFTRLSDRINQSAVYYALGRLELRAGNYGAAEDYLRRSIEVTENIRRVPASSDLTAAFSATVYERYESYVECLMREHESQPSRGLDVLAFEMSELARARSLAELLRATQTDLVKGLDPQMAQREKSLRQALRVKEDLRVTLLGGKYKGEELAGLDAELARLEAEYAQVNDAIRAAFPAYGYITHPTAWDARAIREQVVADDQTILLEFLLSDEKSYVWAVTRDGVRGYELPARARIDDAVSKAYQLISAPPGTDSDAETGAALRELSGTVLSPVAAELKNKSRVIVVADGMLNYIPFQTLTASASGDEPAVTGYEVVNAPSASVLGELRREAARRRPPEKLLAAFGNPVFASNYAQRRDAEGGGELAALQMPDDGRLQLLAREVSRDIELNGDAFDPSTIQPLFYAKRELTNLLDVTAGGETFVASGFDATRERLFGTDLSQYSILHFATHGMLDTKRPESSGLVLSTVGRDGRALNGFVGLRDIYSIRAPVDLVVLSACQTALGKDVRGEGLLSLTRGFMYAGASGVVASLWKAEDKATSELMKQFYANMLEKGMPPGAALRDAQNSIRQNPRWRSPYYWAAFTLQGEYGRAIRHRPGNAGSSLKVAGLACVLALLAAAAWWYRRRPRAAAGRT